MAQSNSWIGLKDPQEIAQIMNVGIEGLRSGAITPAEAIKRAKSMGLPVPDIKNGYGSTSVKLPEPNLKSGYGSTSVKLPEPDPRVIGAAKDGQVQVGPISLSMANPVPLSPMDMSAKEVPVPAGPMNLGAAQTPEAMTPANAQQPGKIQSGNFAKDSTRFATHNTQTSAEHKMIRPEDVGAAAENFRNMPEVKNLQAGEGDLQNLLSMEAMRENSDPGWVKPLLALADSQTGSKLMEGFTPGISPDQKLQTMLKYQDELQKRRADIAKTMVQGINAQKNGSVLTNKLDQLGEAMSNSGFKPMTTMDPLSRIEIQNAYRQHGQNLSIAKHDPVLNDMFSRYRSVNDAISNLTNAHSLPKQSFEEAQAAIRTALFPKGVQSGVDERAATYMQNAGFSLDNIMQIISGTPAKISQDDPMIRHIEDLAQNMKTNFAEGARRRLSYITGGQDWIYDDPRFSHLADSLQHFTELGNAQFRPTPNATKGLNRRSAPGATHPANPEKAAPPKPAQVKQNGFTYTLNPKTGEYE